MGVWVISHKLCYFYFSRNAFTYLHTLTKKKTTCIKITSFVKIVLKLASISAAHSK